MQLLLHCFLFLLHNIFPLVHGNINGRIDKSGTNKVKFKIKNFSAGNMLEIRVVTKEKMFNVEGKTFTMLNGIQKEETRWASKTNENIKKNRIILIIILSIEVIILLFIFKDIKTYFNINKSGNKIEKRNLEYFRDIPREETSTPGEGAFLYYFDNNFNWTDGKQSDVLAANILNLCLKGYISFEKKLEDKIYISILKGKEDLKEDEKEIYNLIKDAIGKKESIEVKELQDFAKKNYDKLFLIDIPNAARYPTSIIGSNDININIIIAINIPANIVGVGLYVLSYNFSCFLSIIFSLYKFSFMCFTIDLTCALYLS